VYYTAFYVMLQERSVPSGNQILVYEIDESDNNEL